MKEESGLGNQSYGLALNDKTIRFLIRCIDIAQKTESIHPDAEEMEIIRRLGRKADELLDKDYDEYDSEYDLRRYDVPNEDKWNELGKIQIVRRTPMEKKMDNITKVIQDPDQFNVNIASRDRVEQLEEQVDRLEKKMKRLMISMRKRR